MQGLGFGVFSLGFRVQVSECRVQVSGFGFWVCLGGK